MTDSPCYRLMLSDVDGTLLHSDKQLSDINIAAVKRLKEAGIDFTLVSSRPPRAMHWLIEALDITLPVAAFNGGTLIFPDGSPLKTHHLPRETVQSALEQLSQDRIDVWLFANDQWLILNPECPYIGHEQKALGYDFVLVDRFDEYLDRVDKLVGVSADHEHLAALQPEIEAALGEQAHTVRSQPYYLDITAAEATKGKALNALAKWLDVPLEHTVAIGDGENDIPMLERAGFAIAMGQAEHKVKSFAQHVVAEADQNGLAQAIDQVILTRKASCS
ncbi:hypothetical protein IQ22_03452 [Pseudomonas duriflava]|uniref:Cof subfamily protein (Haloacid dehalogenase superfamily)/HAD superfamily hydrolase (TIGR01484 family) n=1 Tax=Pseudomonas duriflava TaxID=459528 RepID=A0A562Q6E9_9PSED|nr:HAD family hydrolase [Pseudomonas duriflava]TWI52309.1 hypothetical protein IQ22_03452 [Pseudomonas duriflava]